MSIYNYYQVGGSLEYQHPSYVMRQADLDLIEKLKSGEYCYVLNSRQMGKSSLRVQVMKKLEEQGFKCASIDMTNIDKHATPQECYAGLVSLLLDSFSLSTKINFNTWWGQQKLLPPLLRFREFIEDVLLREFTQNIVIFFDEIDRIIECTFKEDFFAFIRACYNQRVDNPEYKRLTFCMLGVATPSDLIADKSFNTPFNIGRAIELNGFQLKEASPLAQGLKGKIGNPEAVLASVLAWTGGQPFLTQKLCTLILTTDSPLLAGGEVEWVENLVKSQVIENWESHDKPEHLRTIRARLLSNEQRAPRLLGLYQQILQQGEVIADDSPEHMELRLSGLVVKQQGKLKVYNPIYKSVFDKNWVEKELANLRPLFLLVALKRWEDSKRKDKSWLLRGQALRDAEKWAKGRSLTSSGDDFLRASQKLEREEEQRKKEEAQRKQRIQWLTQSVVVITIILVLTVALAVKTFVQSQTIQARSLLEQAELITQPDLLPRRVALSIKAINKSNSVKLKPFLYDDLALLRHFESLDNNNKDRGSVNTIAFSKHGKYLATAGLDNRISGDGYVCVFESNNQEFNSSPCVFKNNKIGNVNAITFSPDEKYLATASVDGKACVWEITSGKKIMCKDHKVSANAVSFSPDGEYLVTAWADGKVSVLETNGYKSINSMSHQKSVIAMTFSKDGQYIATASLDGTVHVWNDWKRQNNDKEPVKLQHEGPVTDVSFSPDGKFLATVSSDNKVYVWNTIGGKERIMEHDNDVLAVTFSHDGQYLATASLDKTARVWNAKSGKELVKLKHGEVVTDVTFSQDDKYLGTTSRDKTARIWEIPSGDEFARLIHKDEVNAIAFSPDTTDTKYLATASLDGTARVWDIKSDRSNRTVTLIRHREKINAMAFSEKNDYLATASKDNIVRVWSTSSGDKKEFKLPQKKFKGLVTNVALNPDAQYLATVSLDGSAQLWQILSESTEPKKIKNFMYDELYFTSVVFSPNGKYLAMASKDGKACVFETTDDRKKIRCTKNQAENQALVETMAFSSNNTFLATGSRDGKVQVSKVLNLNEPLATLQNEGQPVIAVVFSPDGKYLAVVSSDNTAKIWEVKSKKPVDERNGITDVSFSRDGKYLATVSSDNTAKIWEVKSKKPVDERNGITDVSFSRDGKYLATVSQDNTVEVKTTDDKTLVQTILYDEPVTNVAFILDKDLDNERLAITSGETNSNKTTRVLIWQREQMIKYSCDYLTRNLTKKECHQYFGDNESYQETCNLPKSVY